MKYTEIKSILLSGEEQFSAIIKNIQGYIYSVVYENGKAVSSYHSPRCYEITGYTVEEYLKNDMLWHGMIYTEDRDEVLKIFNGLNREKPQQTVEHRIVKKNGTVAWISNTYTLSFNENDELVRMDGFILDITARKKAQDDLRKQYDYLHNLIDSIPNPVFVKNLSGTYTDCNRAFAQVLGKRTEEVIGLTVNDVAPPTLADVYVDMDASLSEDGGIQKYEADFRHIELGMRRMMFHKALIKLPGSSEKVIVGVMSDVTEYRKAQEELNTVLMRLREMEAIINRGQAVVFLLKADSKLSIVFVSANILQFGYTDSNLIGDGASFFEITHPNDEDLLTEELQQLIALEKNELTLEFRLVSYSGKIHWVEAQIWGKYNEQGKVNFYQGIVTDVSKRKQAQYLLRQSEERYKTFAENSYDLICELNSELKFQYVSPNFTDELGYHANELYNKPLVKLLHADDVPGVLKEIRKDSGKATHRYRHKNGNYLWFESAGKKFKTTYGEVRGVIVSRNVTERKRMEAQLIRTEKLGAIGEMSAMLAHEFRNSLTSVKMILQLQSEATNLLPSQLRSVNVALESLEHMQDVINKLLNFSRPAASEFKRIDVAAVIGNALEFLQRQFEKEKIELNTFFQPELPELYGDITGLKEAFINLLINSVHAMEGRDGERSIEVTAGRIHLPEGISDFTTGSSNEYFKTSASEGITGNELEEGTDCVVISFRDTGPGIPTEMLPHIFEPFFTTKEKGTGLGLPVVKRTINTHGGVILVDSKADEGTMFSLYFPLKK